MPFGSGIADALDPTTKGNAHYANADLTWHDAQFSQNWDVTAQASYYDIAETKYRCHPVSSRSALPLPLPVCSLDHRHGGTAPNTGNGRRRLNLSALYGGFARHKLRLGAGYNRDDLYKVTETKNFTFIAARICVDLSCSIVTATASNGLYFLTPPFSRRPLYTFCSGRMVLAPDCTDRRRTPRPLLGFRAIPIHASPLVWTTAYNLTSKLMFRPRPSGSIVY